MAERVNKASDARYAPYPAVASTASPTDINSTSSSMNSPGRPTGYGYGYAGPSPSAAAAAAAAAARKAAAQEQYAAGTAAPPPGTAPSNAYIESDEPVQGVNTGPEVPSRVIHVRNVVPSITKVELHTLLLDSKHFLDRFAAAGRSVWGC